MKTFSFFLIFITNQNTENIREQIISGSILLLNSLEMIIMGLSFFDNIYVFRWSPNHLFLSEGYKQWRN